MINRILWSIAVLFIAISFIHEVAFSQTPQPAASPSATQSIQYDLAYPGILPDNWLYKIKVLRDKIIEMFLTDPNARVVFYLRQADKGILATAILLDKNEVDLAGTTALKAENNMTMVTQYLSYVDWQKNPDLLTKLKTASMKHQEVLGMLINRLPLDKQKTLRTVLDFSQRNLQSIQQFEAESR